MCSIDEVNNQPGKPGHLSDKTQAEKLASDKRITEVQKRAPLKLVTNHGHNISARTLGHLRSRGLVSAALGYQLTPLGRELAEQLAKLSDR